MPWLLLALSPLNPIPQSCPPPWGFGGPQTSWAEGGGTSGTPQRCHVPLSAATPAHLGTPRRRAVTPHPLAAVTRWVLAPEANLPGSLWGA